MSLTEVAAGGDAALRCHRPAGRNGRAKTRVPTIRFRRLTSLGDGMAQRTVPTT
jgi:hypothetical protein